MGHRRVQGKLARLGYRITASTVWEILNTLRFIEVEYNRARLRKHPEYGYVTPLETRALVAQNLTRSVTSRCPRSWDGGTSVQAFLESYASGQLKAYHALGNGMSE